MMKKVTIKTEYVNGLPVVSYTKVKDDAPTKIIETVDEDYMTAAIMKAVDMSEEKCTFNHIGINDDDSYEIEVPCITLNNASYNWDNQNTGGSLFTLVNIVRRPSDTSNKNDTEYVYDVQMVNEGDTIVESVECIGMQLLCAIYSFVSGNK